MPVIGDAQTGSILGRQVGPVSPQGSSHLVGGRRCQAAGVKGGGGATSPHGGLWKLQKAGMAPLQGFQKELALPTPWFLTCEAYVRLLTPRTMKTSLVLSQVGGDVFQRPQDLNNREAEPGAREALALVTPQGEMPFTPHLDCTLRSPQAGPFQTLSSPAQKPVVAGPLATASLVMDRPEALSPKYDFKTRNAS